VGLLVEAKKNLPSIVPEALLLALNRIEVHALKTLAAGGAVCAPLDVCFVAPRDTPEGYAGTLAALFTEMLIRLAFLETEPLVSGSLST
jgi:hypothetical protein